MPPNAVPIEEWFLEQLPAIERAIAWICLRYGVMGAEAEDFASACKLKLIENDYAILRRFEERSRFQTFIVIVIRRMFFDQRIRDHGKWHSSSEAVRLGDAAVQFEMLLYREGRSFNDAVSIIGQRYNLPRREVECMAARLPDRGPRPTLVNLAHVDLEASLSASAIEDAASAGDRLALAQRVTAIIRTSFAAFSEEDQQVLALRFFGGLTVAEISRALHLDQKMLYRRMERHLRTLRADLEEAGIRRADVHELLEHVSDEFALVLRDALSRPLPITSS